MFQAARQGDAAACRGLDRYLDGLSVGLVNLANVLFPEVICLGGGSSAADDDLLLDPLRELVPPGLLRQRQSAQAGEGQPGQRRRRGGGRPAVRHGVTKDFRVPGKAGRPL
ncbi:MAG: ROK family protein [Oscillospiraceae bacterium]